MNESRDGMVVVYDGQCPFCTRYVKMLRLREAFGEVRLVDARSGEPEAIEAAELFDLDDGMAARVAGEWYHGADCMNVLSLASGPAPLVNRLLARLLSDKGRARALYPWLRGGRNLTLKLWGRHKINGKRF